ncbi:MAG TPA: cytochrome c biogenesis protein CcdA, partial [Candidatus Wallbacteria bacterium]|nr:cytochrome c biogenesis protein CcdA [Candidatus Wallbacteria bacterium]
MTELKRNFIFICVLMVSILFLRVLSAAAEKPEVYFKVLNSPASAPAGSSAEIVIQTDIVKPFHIYAPGDKTGIALSYSISSPAVESFKASYPAPVIKDYPSLGEKLLLYEGVVYSTIEIKISRNVQNGFKLPIKASFQACTDMMCTPPAVATLEAEINITGLPLAAEVSSASSAAAQPAAGQKQKSSFSQFYERSLLLAVAVAFLWGLISSLTPCVYPMIPITVAFFGSQEAAGSRKKTFSLALVFVIGIAVSFAALGVAVTLIGVDLGAVMSNAWVVGLLSALLLFFAGAMFELYEIRVPDSIMSKVGQSEQGYFGAFTMGLTMGLVAAPCVGPFAGSLLIFVSAVNSAAIGFLMLFSYGMGLGMLFLAVALGAGFLPKSGMWMVRLKNF